MNKRERAEMFTHLVGLELKGRIVSQGFTAAQVASTMGRSPSAFNRWLNGKADLPLAVLCEACEVIDADPSQIVSHAYDRLAVAYGEHDGRTYDREAADAALEEIARLTRADADAPVVTLPARGRWDEQQRAASEDTGIPKDEED